jgi:hypothetical protein
MRRALLALLLVMGAPALARAQAQPEPPKDKPAGGVAPDEIERLRREIESEARSSLELLFDGHAETGGLNDKLGFLRFGARLNLRRGEGSTLRITAIHTPYTTEDGVVEERGTSLGIGGLGRRSESVDYEWEIGAVRFSTDRWDGTGLVRLTVRSSDALRYSVGLSRTLVEESMLSAVGLDPVVGPFAGERVGAVTDNRLSVAGSWQLPSRAELVAEGALGVYTGKNAGSNLFKRFGGGPAWNAIARAPEESVSFLRVGAWFEYFGFDEDRLGYGGASLVDARGEPVPLEELGSDGISPEPDPPHPGVGGYFSPESFTSLVGRVELRGRASPRLDYAASAFLGRQSYTGVEPRGAGGIALNLKLRLGERLSLPLSYVWDDYGPFAQQTLRARLVWLF